MDYEEKYKSALKWMQSLYGGLHGATKEEAEKYFPELKDSEDERMRKEFCKDIRTFIPNEKANKYIAWIEKQGNKIVDCQQNHQDIKYPNGGIVMEDFNGGEGFYKLHLDYLSKKQVEEVEEMVKTWNKESKISDENIINCIGMCLTDANEQRFQDYDTTLKDCLAWLEKQGLIDKDKLAKGFLRSVATTIMQYLDSNTAEGKMCLSNMECEDIENAVFNADWAKVYRYMKKKLEKQGEQKPTDKIEPKFKVGDWISGYYTNYKVTAINSKGYVVEDTDGNKINILFENEKFHHLWTIQDAKDGDVLVASDGSIFLFAGVDDCACKYYVALTTDNCLKINREVKGGYWETSRAVYPATKEQRDLLFQKMADAGYEFVNGHITRF